MNAVIYCLKQGLRNLVKNPLFTFASVATVSACIFLFSVFLIIAYDLRTALSGVENNVGITVFFEEGVSDETKEAVKNGASGAEGVREVRYTSADEAWDGFRKTYFGEDYEELSAAFEGENPLKYSDSLEIFTEDIEQQTALVEMLRNTEGVREVNFASSAVSLLKKVNRWVIMLSAVLIGILFAVSVFLIGNTINVAAVFRRKENEIMKLIGAGDYMIRAPFVIEGVLIGAAGAFLPLLTVNLLYRRFLLWYDSQLSLLSVNAVLLEALRPQAPDELRKLLILCALIMGVGMGFFVSLLTVNRHLRKMR